MNGQSDWSQLVLEIRRNIFNLIFFPIEGGCATTPTTTAPAAPKKRPTTTAKRRRRRLAAENQAELDDALQNLYKDVVYNH